MNKSWKEQLSEIKQKMGGEKNSEVAKKGEKGYKKDDVITKGVQNEKTN